MLNIPPNKKGEFAATDVKNLYEFRSILDETFKSNLAKGNIPSTLTDQKLSSFNTVSQGKTHYLTFKKPVSFDRIALQENIANGQNCAQGNIEYWTGTKWKLLVDFTTIGYKRLLKTKLLKASKFRLNILKAERPVQLSEVGFYKASAREGGEKF
ncbi:MAG: hypothetical protein EOO07_34395 [Chitinophagaceae bacterium]|nr:MAG: hypothetical protein EOO07_34395 [Chitinophagaceae bacterium]